MAIKIKQEPIPLNDEDEDEEALRLAALRTLKAKQALKPPPSVAAALPSPTVCRPAAPCRRPPGLPPYRSAPPYRHPAPLFRHRTPFPPYAAPPIHPGEAPRAGFQRHIMNPNLISIVPVSDSQPPKPEQEVPHQKMEQRLQDKQTSSVSSFSQQKSSSATTDAEKQTVPSKFSRIDASDSESDDDLLTKKKQEDSDDEADDGDNEPESTIKNKSEFEDDSLEKLMEEMEQEMNRSTSVSSKPSTPVGKKQKRSNEKNKSVASKQIPPNVIEEKIINIKKEKEDLEKVEHKSIVKPGDDEKVQAPVNIKPVAEIVKPTCIEPLTVKIKQEPIDSVDVSNSTSSAPRNTILEKVVETSSLSPIRIKSPKEVNSQIKTDPTSPLNDGESKEETNKSSPANASKDEKLSPTKSTCSSPVELVERSPVSPITVEGSPKSDRTDLLDEEDFTQDKERSHPSRKLSRSPIHRSNSPAHRMSSRKFSRSPSPRTYRQSPEKQVFYRDSDRGAKSNGRTSPFTRFPNKNRAQDLVHSYYSNNTSHPYSPSYGPGPPDYSDYPVGERSRSPFYSRNYQNSSSLYSDKQNARYHHTGGSEEISRLLSRYPSPRRRSRSPRRLSRSPKRWSRSPRRLSRSPRRLSRSPRRLSRSPRRLSRSPRRLSRSPRRLSRSPRRFSRSPRRLSRSPRRSPRRLSRSPRLQSRSPSPKSRSPKRYIARPSRRRSPWNSRVQHSYSSARPCISRSPTPHESRDKIRRSSVSPKKILPVSSKRSPGPESGQERQLSPHLRQPLSPRKHSRSPAPTRSPSRAKRASVSPLRTSKSTRHSRSPRREASPRNVEAGQRYRQRSLSPMQAHPESRRRQSSLSPMRKEPTCQKDQTNSFRRYSPGYRRQLALRRCHNPHIKSRSPPRKTSPLQTQYKNPANKWEPNWNSDYQSSRRAVQTSQPPATKSASPPPVVDSNKQRSRTPVRDDSDLKSRRRSPQNPSRRQAPRRRDLVERNRVRDRRDRRRDIERERVRDRSREKSKVEHDKRGKANERVETGNTEQEPVEDKEPIINDPVMEARRRKFESNDLVQPISKKICLKSKSNPEVTQEEEMTTEKKLHTEDDNDNYAIENAEEEDDEMLDLGRYDKAFCSTEDVLDLGADNVLWEEDLSDWNRKIEVSGNNQAKQAKEKEKDLRSKVSEKRRHKHKSVTDKACSPLVESPPVKKKKKKKEAISVTNEHEQDAEEKKKQENMSDSQQEDSTDKNQECELKDEKIDDLLPKDTNEDCDLRAELSRRRAERLTKARSLHDSLPKRLLQSAFQGLIGKNRTEAKGSTVKVAKQATLVQSKVQSLPKAEMPSEAGKRRVVLLKHKKPARKASFQIGLKVTKESDSDSLPSYSEDESEENEDDSADQSDSDVEDEDARSEELLAMKRKQLAKQERVRLPVKCRLGSAIDRGLKQKRKFFRRNQVRKSPSVNIDMHAPSSKKKVSIGLKTGKVGKSNKLTLLY